MLKLVPARFIGALFCAAVATMALPAVSQANEDLSADAPTGMDTGTDTGMDEVEIQPPNGGDEMPARSGAEPSPADAKPARPSAAAKPSSNDNASKQAAREAAKRALFGDPKKEGDKPNPLLDVRNSDYYDRRAKDLLQSDSDRSKVELHPLMEAHPDSYVVVCTAGCVTGRGAEIVSMLPKPAAAQAPVSTPDAQNGGNVVSCVAGCGAEGNIAMASTPSAGPAIVGEWMTTVAKVPALAEAPAPKAAGSGDWMDKINQDRAQQKAAQPATSDTPAVTKDTDAKPATAPIAAAPKAAPPVDSKPAAVATAKPAAPPAAPMAEAKPAPAVAPTVVEAKPAVAAEAKAAPAAQTVEAKPAPAVTVEAKPAPIAKTVTAADATLTEPAPAKPIVVAGEAQPAAGNAKVEGKAPAVAMKPAPSATQMAALEAPKAPASAPAIKPADAAPAAGNGSLFKDSAKVTTPVPAPAEAIATKTATPPVAPEAKPSSSNGSLFKESAKVAAPAPEAKPATPPVAATEQKPAPGATSLFKDQTKVAAVTPPAVDKPAAAVPAKQKDGVISVLSEDKDMNAAIEKARGSLSSFWKSYDAPASGEADHALKVAVAGNGTTEHFWLTRIKRDGGKISGVISNQPQSVKTVKVGQRYEFTEDMISDWTFKRNGKLVGNETMRVLLPRMPEEQAAVYRKMYETP
jgi:uncharacterized protein YegJ (DUF2314 family)